MEVINGYHGGFQKGINNVQLQKCSDNSISEKDFVLNARSSLNSDKATINHEVNQSQGPGNYNVDTPDKGPHVLLSLINKLSRISDSTSTL